MTEPPFLAEARAFYDAIAVDYQDRITTALPRLPVERSVLRLFAELVGPGGEVLDAGCGPGRVTAHLAGLGLACRGLDLSPVLVELARATFPDLRFDLGSLTDLQVAQESLDGLLAWYSLIHVPPEARHDVLVGFRRALRPGAHLLVAFQVRDEPLRVEAPDGRRCDDGRPVALDFHGWHPDEMVAQLVRVGFEQPIVTCRPPGPTETAPQASVIARRT